MQMSSHEAHELNELLMSCTNSIQCMALFINQAQDPMLREMILRHYSAHVQDYNMKVEFVRQRNGSQDQLNVPNMEFQSAGTMPNLQNPQFTHYPPIQPQVRLNQLDDRAIATSYLLTLKRAGREYAWAAFETTTPAMRSFLEDAFRMCSHQAYEVWSFMAGRGWYPITMASRQSLQTFGHVYREVPNHQPANQYVGDRV